MKAATQEVKDEWHLSIGLRRGFVKHVIDE